MILEHPSASITTSYVTNWTNDALVSHDYSLSKKAGSNMIRPAKF